jgi:hypothetical protein
MNDGAGFRLAAGFRGGSTPRWEEPALSLAPAADPDTAVPAQQNVTAVINTATFSTSDLRIVTKSSYVWIKRT